MRSHSRGPSVPVERVGPAVRGSRQQAGVRAGRHDLHGALREGLVHSNSRSTIRTRQVGIEPPRRAPDRPTTDSSVVRRAPPRHDPRRTGSAAEGPGRSGAWRRPRCPRAAAIAPRIASTVRSASSSRVSQSETETRIANSLWKVVPPTHAVPSAWTRAMTSRVSAASRVHVEDQLIEHDLVPEVGRRGWRRGRGRCAPPCRNRVRRSRRCPSAPSWRIAA